MRHASDLMQHPAGNAQRWKMRLDLGRAEQQAGLSGTSPMPFQRRYFLVQPG
jgi:hypothetical protein